MVPELANVTHTEISKGFVSALKPTGYVSCTAHIVSDRWHGVAGLLHLADESVQIRRCQCALDQFQATRIATVDRQHEALLLWCRGSTRGRRPQNVMQSSGGQFLRYCIDYKHQVTFNNASTPPNN